MQVTSVKEMKGVREATQGIDWKRTYKRKWRVQTDDPRVGPLQVRQSVPVLIGSPYNIGTEHDTGSWCISLGITETAEDGRQWEVTADYGPIDPNQKPADPTMWIPKISWGGSKFQKNIDKDANGKDIVTSAGLPFNPTLQNDDTRPLLQIVWNQRNFDESLSENYRDTLNQNTWFGYQPLCVKCETIAAVRTFDADFGYYYEVTYEFAINKDTWKAKPLDAGLYQLNTAGTDITPIKKNGVPVTEPIPLDGSGHALTPGNDPVYLEFDQYLPQDFTALGLDWFYSYLQSYVPPQGGPGI